MDGSAVPAKLRLLIAEDWILGDGQRLASVNPASPEEVVAEGQNAVTADVEWAVRAACAAQRQWSRTPIHERGAVLVRQNPGGRHRRSAAESGGSDPHVPFGGAKKSSYGPKEQGSAAKDFYTHTTTVYLRG